MSTIFPLSSLLGFINTRDLSPDLKNVFTYGADAVSEQKFAFKSGADAGFPKRFSDFSFKDETVPVDPGFDPKLWTCQTTHFGNSVSNAAYLQNATLSPLQCGFALTNNNKYAFLAEKRVISGVNHVAVKAYPVSGSGRVEYELLLPGLPEGSAPAHSGFGFEALCTDQTDYFKLPPTVVPGNTNPAGIHFDQSVNVLFRLGYTPPSGGELLEHYMIIKLGVTFTSPARMWWLPLAGWRFEEGLAPSSTTFDSKQTRLRDIESRPGEVYLAGYYPVAVVGSSTRRNHLLIIRANQTTGKSDVLHIPTSNILPDPKIRIAIDHSLAAKTGRINILVMMDGKIFVIDGTSRTSPMTVATQYDNPVTASQNGNRDINANCGLAFVIGKGAGTNLDDIYSFDYKTPGRPESLHKATGRKFGLSLFSLSNPLSSTVNNPARQGTFLGYNSLPAANPSSAQNFSLNL